MNAVFDHAPKSDVGIICNYQTIGGNPSMRIMVLKMPKFFGSLIKKVLRMG